MALDANGEKELRGFIFCSNFRYVVDTSNNLLQSRKGDCENFCCKIYTEQRLVRQRNWIKISRCKYSLTKPTSQKLETSASQFNCSRETWNGHWPICYKIICVTKQRLVKQYTTANHSPIMLRLLLPAFVVIRRASPKNSGQQRLVIPLQRKSLKRRLLLVLE